MKTANTPVDEVKMMEIDKFATNEARRVAYGLYQKMPSSERGQHEVEDLAQSLLMEYLEYARKGIDVDGNWKAYIRLTFNNKHKSMLDEFYDTEHLSAIYHNGEQDAAVEYDEDGEGHAVLVDTKDAETLMVEQEDEKSLELLRRTKFYCLLFDTGYNEAQPLESLLAMLGKVTVDWNLLPELLGKTREEILDLKELVEQRGLRVGLHKGVARAKNVVATVRELFDRSTPINTREGVIEYFNQNALYYNAPSLRNIIASLRREYGLAPEGREKSERSRGMEHATQLIRQNPEMKIAELQDIMKREYPTVRPSSLFGLMKWERKHNPEGKDLARI